ncbi:MAG: DUF2284 domain-containing protein [Clostridia bacterium]|nr:DUF2284 domain-containing protein [Clostridia bacterium]
MSYSELIKEAKAVGFTGVEHIPAESIVLSREFRDACAANRCGAYGKCYMCPPDVGDIDELMATVRTYTHGLLLQTVAQLEDSYDFEGMTEARKNHSRLTRELWKRVRPLLPDGSLCLGVGGCGFCSKCAKRDGLPCRSPENAMASLEAYGVNVSSTVANTSLKYVNGQDTVTYFGLILFN